MFTKSFSFFLLLLMFCDIKLVGSMELGYVVSSRPDRYGTNVLGWVSAILIANQHNIPLYHLCDTCHEKKISFDEIKKLIVENGQNATGIKIIKL